MLSKSANGWLDAATIERLLQAYGIPIAVSGIASSADEAVSIADRAGYPVVLKLLAEGRSLPLGTRILYALMGSMEFVLPKRCRSENWPLKGDRHG